MAQVTSGQATAAAEEADLVESIAPDVSHIATEDDIPVDNFGSEKQQRLATEPLYSSWSGPEGRPLFLVAANVGLFRSPNLPPIVPDVFLSLDVTAPDDWWEKRQRTYFVWQFGKVPEVVVEIVSNRKGSEDESKMAEYARMRIPYYVIFDPIKQLREQILTVYALTPRSEYEEISGNYLAGVELGLKLWEGEFEGKMATWLRWTDANGRLIPTGKERADLAQTEAEQERLRAETAEQRAETAEQRAEQLAAKLRALGIDPDDNS